MKCLSYISFLFLTYLIVLTELYFLNIGKYFNINKSYGEFYQNNNQFQFHMEHQFNKTQMLGVLFLQDVCIEADPLQRKVEVQKRLGIGTHLNMTRRVLVKYNALQNITVIHKVGANKNVHVLDWEVIYRQGLPPKNVYMENNCVAYFMTSSCDGNLFHFFEDSLQGLYSVVKKTNRLHSKQKNIVFYREPLWEYKELLQKYVQCWDPLRS